MKEGVFVSLWRLESDFLCGSDWESRGTHREPASVWRCQMTGFAPNTLLLNSTLKWPLIDHQTYLLWSRLLCKPVLDGGTASECELVVEREHRCRWCSDAAFLYWMELLAIEVKLIYYQVNWNIDSVAYKPLRSSLTALITGLVSFCLGASCDCGECILFMFIHVDYQVSHGLLCTAGVCP